MADAPEAVRMWGIESWHLQKALEARLNIDAKWVIRKRGPHSFGSAKALQRRAIREAVESRNKYNNECPSRNVASTTRLRGCPENAGASESKQTMVPIKDRVNSFRSKKLRIEDVGHVAAEEESPCDRNILGIYMLDSGNAVSLSLPPESLRDDST
ncbi:hypothetical protein BJV78DRAFT_1158070 [Lactifluus subvellereus]|nr:hypothetical protein BJV78DRAFT_1158070 [Lactifluus subvellereus]